MVNLNEKTLVIFLLNQKFTSSVHVLFCFLIQHNVQALTVMVNILSTHMIKINFWFMR
jgi:hypothetical protein